MSETTPSTRNSSDVERGGIPEVAALGNALTALFNTLEISQSVYGVRVCMDKSIVSRYLRGRRVATQDFIDRLVREVETERGASLQPEVRSRLAGLRLDALRVTDPAVYELESLRAEMARSARQVQTLVRHQEALHDLLDKRESEARAAQGELAAVRQDWTADILRAERAEMELREHAGRHSTERERLEEEIARLRAEVSEVASLKAEAERRCADLEEQVRSMEETLAAHVVSAADTLLPLSVFKEQLAELVAAGEQREASREIAEAAWSRPVRELVDLDAWLVRAQDHSRRHRLLTEVVHSRSLAELAEFGRLVHRVGSKALPPVLIEETASVRSPREIVQLHTEWLTSWSGKRANLLKSMLRQMRHEDDVVEALALVDPHDETAFRLLRNALTGPGYEKRDARIVARLEEIGRPDVASALGENLFAKAGIFAAWSLVGAVDEGHRAALTDVVLRTMRADDIVILIAEELGPSLQRAGSPSGLEPHEAAFLDKLRFSDRLPEVLSRAASLAPHFDVLLGYLGGRPDRSH
ncbi:hypothetical protein [Streptomyces sp. NPDC086777]|uniref:hypothetical protein n=1 Tax=Streptomyces sp. NPDC086777 TaxID=3154866 RepID=UPI003450F912